MATLLLQLYGPMQSWRTGARLERRATQPLPSKSGVVGLLAAALGRPRGADVSDLAALRMGVRADRPGRVEIDYQTVREVVPAGGGRPKNVQSWREYVADAAFLVGLEGERGFLEELARALQRPARIPYLGQKGFYPAAPIYRGIRLRKGLEEALTAEPAIVRAHEPFEANLYLEDPAGGMVLYDAPEPELPRIGYPRALGERRLTVRRVTVQPEEVSA